jgi:hypothetical protein
VDFGCLAHMSAALRFDTYATARFQDRDCLRAGNVIHARDKRLKMAGFVDASRHPGTSCQVFPRSGFQSCQDILTGPGIFQHQLKWLGISSICIPAVLGSRRPNAANGIGTSAVYAD